MASLSHQASHSVLGDSVNSVKLAEKGLRWTYIVEATFRHAPISSQGIFVTIRPKIRLQSLAGGQVRIFEITVLAFMLFQQGNVVAEQQPAIQSETLLQSRSSWDGEPYVAYPAGQPELSVLKITIPPHTQLKWHAHPMPNVAYILSGELTLERKKDDKKQHFIAGQVVPEMIDVLHRGVTGEAPVTLIVFYAGTEGMPLSK
jgi:quercetin dioxygenase-like cupin family protein